MYGCQFRSESRVSYNSGMSTADGLVRDPILGVIDTSPEINAIMIEGFRNMPGWRKLERLRSLNALGLALAMADLRERHPDATEREYLLRLASRCVDPTVLHQLCGWDVEVEGY
jgi:hypothetical protein